MKLQHEKEKEILDEKYPAGSKEREILEYSSSKHEHDEVPPMLLAAFRVLMGISIVMAIAAIVGYYNHKF